MSFSESKNAFSARGSSCSPLDELRVVISICICSKIINANVAFFSLVIEHCGSEKLQKRKFSLAIGNNFKL